MNRAVLREICFEFANGRPVDTGHVTTADFEQFVSHVNEVAHVYRQVLDRPPLINGSAQVMEPGATLQAMASLGSHRVLALGQDLDALRAVVVQRHERLSAAGPLSMGDLTAIVMHARRRAGADRGPEASVEVAEAILGRVFPLGVVTAGAGETVPLDPERVEDRLVPGAVWVPTVSRERVTEALYAAGRESVAVVVEGSDRRTEGHDTGHVTLYVNLGPEAQGAEPRIARVDQRAARPVETLSHEGPAHDEREWSAGDSPMTRMAVIDGTGRIVTPDTLSVRAHSATTQAVPTPELVDDQRIPYARAAADFERALGRHLPTMPEVADFSGAVMRAAWEYVAEVAPHRLTLFGTNIRSSPGAIGDELEVLRHAAFQGTVREQMAMLWNGRRNGLFEALPSAAERAVAGLPVAGHGRPSEWIAADQPLHLPMLSDFQEDAERTGTLVSTGTSGIAYLFMRTISALGAYTGQLFDLQAARLALLATLLPAGHHTFHEVMNGVAIWAAETGNEESLGYVDSRRRYRHLAPLTEDALRRDVAENGLFPDEISRGLAEPDPITIPTLPADDELASRENEDDTLVGGVVVEPVTGWSAARAQAVVRRAEAKWVDPVSQPAGVGGRRAPRYLVSSDFDVRVFEVGGRTYTDLTIRYELAAGEGVPAGAVDAVWERALEGVEEVSNQGEVLPDGSILHMTLERVDSGSDPHARVTVVGPGAPTDQFRWSQDATARILAHETLHQVGGRDGYVTEGSEHRGTQGDGNIMGDESLPAPEGMRQGGLRPRHLQLMHAHIVNAVDLPTFHRTRAARRRAEAARAARLAGSGAAVTDAKDALGIAPPVPKGKEKAANPSQTPVADAYDHANPENPGNVWTIEHLERTAGLRGADGKSTTKAAQLRTASLTAAKARGSAGTPRNMDDIVSKIGPALLTTLRAQPAGAPQLDVFRAMSVDEAQSTLAYWNGPGRLAAEDFLATGKGNTAKDFKQRHTGLTIGSHLGGRRQAEFYHRTGGTNYEVLLQFKLKPNAHKILFRPEFMALGPGYASELIRKSHPGSYQAANRNEGTLPGYIGFKSENHGAFSLSIAQGTLTKGIRLAGPSQLLFQLLVDTVTVVGNKSGIPLADPETQPADAEASTSDTHTSNPEERAGAPSVAAFLDAPRPARDANGLAEVAPRAPGALGVGDLENSARPNARSVVPSRLDSSLIGPAVRSELPAGWATTRAEAVARRAGRAWGDPASRPMDITGSHASRHAVESDFDVRAFEVEDRHFTDLTIRVALTAGDGVSESEADALWERVLEGAETVYNAGALLPDDSALHVTLERVAPGKDPHLRVTAVAAGESMDQHRWPVDATALAGTQAIGRQLGLKDEYQGATADGDIIGDERTPASESLAETGLRPHHLQDLHAEVRQAQDPESFERTRHRGESDAAEAPQLSPALPAPTEVRADDPRGPLLGALWRKPQEANTLLPVREAVSGSLEISDFIPHELKAELDALAAQSPAHSAPEALDKHDQDVAQLRNKVVASTVHAVRVHLDGSSGMGLLNTALSYTFEADSNFQNSVILAQQLVNTFQRGMIIHTGIGQPINLCA
ncbi:hypothetical protein [Streptomyces sp. NPDC090080]|uniref:hypothetical protein n=1 Tax=Streptomyces sp. NPDC090080 TaxID=3365939 RepID=UPI00381AE8D3